MKYVDEDTYDESDIAITLAFVAVVFLLAGLLVGLGVAGARSSNQLEQSAPALDIATLNALTACLEDEATEACHVELTTDGYDVIGKRKGEYASGWLK